MFIPAKSNNDSTRVINRSTSQLISKHREDKNVIKKQKNQNGFLISVKDEVSIE